MNAKTPSLGGVSILTVTPLDAGARLAERDFASLLRFVTSPAVEGEGVSGVTVIGEMGEGYSLTVADRARAIALAKEVVGPKRHVIAALFALSQRDAVEQARVCRDAGADAILAAPVPPFLYSDRALTLFFGAIAEASGLPVIAYLNKMFKNPLPSAETVRATYAAPGVVGIKDSSGDAAFQELLLKERPAGKLMIQTVTGMALSGVLAGADGVMVGTSNLAPEAALGVWAHGRRKDAASQEKARAAQERLKAVAKLYALAGGPKGSSKDWVIVKEALAQLGVIAEAAKLPAPPYEALGAEDRAKVAELLAQLGLKKEAASK